MKFIYIWENNTKKYVKQAVQWHMASVWMGTDHPIQQLDRDRIAMDVIHEKADLKQNTIISNTNTCSIC